MISTIAEILSWWAFISIPVTIYLVWLNYRKHSMIKKMYTSRQLYDLWSEWLNANYMSFQKMARIFKLKESFVLWLGRKK